MKYHHSLVEADAHKRKSEEECQCHSKGPLDGDNNKTVCSAHPTSPSPHNSPTEESPDQITEGDNSDPALQSPSSDPHPPSDPSPCADSTPDPSTCADSTPDPSTCADMDTSVVRPVEACVVTEPADRVEEAESKTEPVEIKVMYKKQKYKVCVDLSDTVLELKKQVETLSDVPVACQKLIYKGSTQDHQTMRDLKIDKNAKFLLIGSTMTDILKVTAPDLAPSNTSGSNASTAASSSTKEPFSKQQVHKKVLDKYGKPDDVVTGVLKIQLLLPTTPLIGMYNKYGHKTRLTFRLDTDELWISTKERTQKVKLNSIKSVVSEAIEGHEEYHILGLQLGATELSKYWLYWVPAQFIAAIKDTVLGKWDFD